MTSAPDEYRILTALMLQPMPSRTLATALALPIPTVCRRLSYLRGTGHVKVTSDHGKTRPAYRYALTDAGCEWAAQIVGIDTDEPQRARVMALRGNV